MGILILAYAEEYFDSASFTTPYPPPNKSVVNHPIYS
ncbi:hypothetical protein BRADI_1g31875v3 [Brachypodium distachyon]|uniref:Uncharacterized protein n=1 Tax=Brachypodium distachyon TaxID=15368 RepID=A0A2K2DM96_BRADI|nr:hypothetical protein BRADI_1g31875v3 [Brachypodium distachyon]